MADVTAARGITRRRFLAGSTALAAAGWVSGSSGGWMLEPAWAADSGPIKFGIATDMTGPIAPAGIPTWQVMQLAAKKINDAGGVAGRPIKLFLVDTASDEKVAVGNVTQLIEQSRADVVMGGITSSMRAAIKNPIVNRGKTLYMYPQLYEGQECTPYLFCTGPTPAQQCAKLIPYLISNGHKRFALPGGNFLWPQLLIKYASNLIETRGGEVVLKEFYPLDQLEYSATVAKIKSEKVDCVFNMIIPPGLQAFSKQLYESGFQKNGGVVTCVFFDENSATYLPDRELQGIYSCLDYYKSVEDPVGAQLQKEFREMFPSAQYQFTAGTGATGAYRAMKFYQAAVLKTGGDLRREAVAAAMDGIEITEAPGGGAKMIAGTRHCAMNMYVAAAENKSYKILDKAEMVDPEECRTK